MVRDSIAFRAVKGDRQSLALYLRSGTLRTQWGAAAFLPSAGTAPPPTALRKVNFARTKTVLARALKSLTKLLISPLKYMYASVLKLPINLERAHPALW